MKTFNNFEVLGYDVDHFIDGKYIGSGLVFRVYLDVDFSSLSHKQIKNIEKVLREKGVPIPICPISSYSLSLYYHD